MKYQSRRRQQDRLKQKLDRTQAQNVSVIPKSPTTVLSMSYLKDESNKTPKWYAGAGDHFGEVKNRYYAEKFFKGG